MRPFLYNRVIGAFSRRRDSKWIYATKNQEKMHRKLGRIAIYSHLSHDTHNASLRLVEHLQNAHVIVTSNPSLVHRYMQALGKMERYAEADQQTQYSSNNLPATVDQMPKSLKQIEEMPVQKLQYETEIEISRFIQMEKEINKGKGQEQNSYIAREANSLKQFMSVKALQQKFIEIKNQQGYPTILKLGHQEHNEEDVMKFHQEGFNVVCLFGRGQQQDIALCGRLIEELENKKAPYQILPCSDELLKAIVCSGLPADRFSLEYFPEEVSGLLARRKNTKITVCMTVITAVLESVVGIVKKIYGQDHYIYIHGEKGRYFRGQAKKSTAQYFDKYCLEDLEIKSQISYLVIAPFISDFNQSLQAELNLKSHLLGQILDSNINPIQLRILMQKMSEMNKKQEQYQIDTHMMTAQLLARLKNEKAVIAVLRELFPRKTEAALQGLIAEARKHVLIDHLAEEENLAEEGKNP